MDDREILDHIGKLVDSEHELYSRAERESGLDAEDRERLHSLKVALDQYWDLLDRRRALRSAGYDPSEARLRDAKTVEKYLQ